MFSHMCASVNTSCDQQMPKIIRSLRAGDMNWTWASCWAHGLKNARKQEKQWKKEQSLFMQLAYVFFMWPRQPGRITCNVSVLLSDHCFSMRHWSKVVVCNVFNGATVHTAQWHLVHWRSPTLLLWARHTAQHGSRGNFLCNGKFNLKIVYWGCANTQVSI